MMISSRGRYALRVMIDLAQHDNGELTSLKDIAERQEISIKYLELIVSTLNKGGMLVSGRGKKGGYRLRRRPEEYSVGSILKLTEKTLAPVNCPEIEDSSCGRAGECVTLPLWKKLDDMVQQYLDSVTLKDVLEGEV